jgi:glutamate-ammonia-ligase adenylyltransferase
MVRPNFSHVPTPLKAGARERWGRFVAAGAGPALQQALLARDAETVFAASDFIADSVGGDPALVDELRPDRLDRAAKPGELAAAVHAALDGVCDEASLARALRRVRRREAIRIAWRDLANQADLDETLSELSALADACLDGALARLSQWHTERHGAIRDADGRPRALVVLGFGKLGAGELNFSSDVDLVFAYAGGGTSDGPHPLDADTWFMRLGRKLIGTLAEPTADGFVYRVDMRLRPFGASGPLAASFAAIENYYQVHGRDWERYALVKARPVAGDIAAGRELLEGLRPFVYRRYFDYTAFDSLRDMKATIAREVARAGLDDNIKLGRGGIREIEFIVQLFQLIRGGREPALRERRLRLVLARLAEADHLNPDDAAALDAAYVFLRRVENRLQMAAERQTHELPAEPAGQARLAASMDTPDWAAFAAALKAHRGKVRAVFDLLFGAPEPAPHSASDAIVAWQNTLAGDRAEPALAALGFGPSAATGLSDFAATSAIRSIGARGRGRLDELMPRLIESAAAAREPDAVLLRLLRLVETVARRAAYLALLADNDNVLRHLTALAGASPWLLKQVGRAPLLLDELIDPRIFEAAPDRAALVAELDERLADVASADQEAQMDALRQFQQATVLRIAAADLAGRTAAPTIARRLTALGEAVIETALRLSNQRLLARHGRPRAGADARPAHLAIIAYGTLGAAELGYGSDLDLVFIHDVEDGAVPTGGEEPIASSMYFARLSQRIISLLTTATAAGTLYRVDTRLRPSGGAGLLVSAFGGFARYQRVHARTWEYQALVRARMIAGNDELGGRFEALRNELIRRERDPAALKRDMAAMREQMRRELAPRTADGFDIKQSEGGLVDIQFIVQFHILAHAHAHPELMEPRGTAGGLAALAGAGLIAAASADELADIHADYLARIHRLTLEDWGTLTSASEFRSAPEKVKAIWRETFDSQ